MRYFMCRADAVTTHRLLRPLANYNTQPLTPPMNLIGDVSRDIQGETDDFCNYSTNFFTSAEGQLVARVCAWGVLTVQPPDVLLLLLVVNVVGDEEGEARVDAPLLEVLLEQDLQVLVEVVEGRAGVERPPRPVLLGGGGVGQVSGWEVVEVLDEEVAVLGRGFDGQRALAGPLDADAGASGEALLAGLVVVVVLEFLAVGGRNAVLGRHAHVAVGRLALIDGALGVGPTRLHVHVGVVKGAVLGHVLTGHVVVEVCGGESQANLLVVEGTRQDDFLVAGRVLQLEAVSGLAMVASVGGIACLERAVLEVFLDVGRQVVVLLHVLLHGDLALQLRDQLIADWLAISHKCPHRAAIYVPALLSCRRAAEMWKDAVSRGTEAAHAGWTAKLWRRSEACGRAAWVERRAADRGALRARLRRASIVYMCVQFCRRVV